MQNTKLLNIKNLNLSYNGYCAVKNLSFSVLKGEIVSIIGPNAAGKSTVLKSIAGLVKADSGTIEVDGKNIFSLTPKELSKKVSILLQTNILPQDLTVKELVYFGRYPYKKYLEAFNCEDSQIVEEVLKLTNMETSAEKKLNELSGGEKQRAWISLSLAQKTPLLLLDEPTTHLDPGHQFEFLNLVTELNKKIGLTVIMVLHDLNQAAKYSRRIIVLKDGKLFASGTPAEILTEDNIKKLYGVNIQIINRNGVPVILP